MESFAITESVVRALLAEVAPELDDAQLRFGARGWDNEMVRVGDTHVLRLPRHASAERLLRNEQRWLPQLAPRLPIAVPLALAAGERAAAWPHPWTLTRWVDGVRAVEVPLIERGAMVEQLGGFLRALHEPAPEAAPVNAVRGVPLASRAAIMATQLADWGERVEPRDRAVYDIAWSAGLAAPMHAGPPRWIHGDLHPLNVIAARGPAPRIAAIIDFSDLASGDPATDLAAAWFLFDVKQRSRLRELLHGHYDDATWTRARAWAAQLALVFVWHPNSDDVLNGAGRHTLDQLHLELGN